MSDGQPAWSTADTQKLLGVLGAVTVSAVDAFAPTPGPASSSQQAFTQELQRQVRQVLGAELDGDFCPVNHPAGFHYFTTYGDNNYFNTATLQAVDSLVQAGSSGSLVLTMQSFSTQYVQFLRAVSYQLSKSDQAAQAGLQPASAAVLAAFEAAGFTYTSPLPPGGKLTDVQNQLTKLYGDWSNLPDTLEALAEAIDDYETLVGKLRGLRAAKAAAEARRQAAIANATTPAGANGGMQTDARSYFVGYTPEQWPSANQLDAALQTSTNTVSVPLDLAAVSGDTASLLVDGRGGATALTDVLRLTTGTQTNSLSDFVSPGSQGTLRVTYKGVTFFSAAPSALAANGSAGWYAGDILSQAIANAGKDDVTGYQLDASAFNPAEWFGAGKKFGRLKTFVISQEPVIELTLQDAAKAADLARSLQQAPAMQLNVLGLVTVGAGAGGSVGGYTVQKVDTAADGRVTVSFGPANPATDVPAQLRVAHVLGGVASYPPDNP